MASGFRIQIHGLQQLRHRLGDGDLIDRMLRPGFEQAAVIVEGAATDNVHRITGKLQRSLGYYLDGHGIGLEAHIGPQPGMSQPAGYTAGETSGWRTPRSGTNTGDPTEYGRYEEEGTRYREGHPFLEPALTDNVNRIEDVIERNAEAAL